MLLFSTENILMSSALKRNESI